MRGSGWRGSRGSCECSKGMDLGYCGQAGGSPLLIVHAPSERCPPVPPAAPPHLPLERPSGAGPCKREVLGLTPGAPTCRVSSAAQPPWLGLLNPLTQHPSKIPKSKKNNNGWRGNGGRDPEGPCTRSRAEPRPSPALPRPGRPSRPLASVCGLLQAPRSAARERGSPSCKCRVGAQAACDDFSLPHQGFCGGIFPPACTHIHTDTHARAYTHAHTYTCICIHT